MPPLEIKPRLSRSGASLAIGSGAAATAEMDEEDIDLDDDDDRRPRSNNAKDLRIGWSPARSSSR